MSNPINRRDFIHKTALAGAGIITTSSQNMPTHDFKRKGAEKDHIKVGIIGSGLRGQNHINVLLNRGDCSIPAICDIDPTMIKSGLELIEQCPTDSVVVPATDRFVIDEVDIGEVHFTTIPDRTTVIAVGDITGDGTTVPGDQRVLTFGEDTAST